MSFQIVDNTKPATPGQRKGLAIAAYVLMCLAPLWFLGAGHFYGESQEALDSWVATEARVVSHRADRDSDGTVYYPRFEFTAADGHLYEVEGNLGRSEPAYKQGEMMPILYPQANPAEAMENSFMSLYLVPMVLGVFGAGNFFFGCLLLYASRRQDLRVTSR